MVIETKVEKDNKKTTKSKNILDVINDDFSYTIKERGKEYYNEGNIINCYKSNDIYYAKVSGSSDLPYSVTIEYNKNSGYEYDCDCPCDFNCKHEYAVALAISNKDYEIKKLKENIPRKKYRIKDIIKEIPSEDLKKYILSHKFNSCYIFENSDFKSYFCNYFPKQEYDYYYNRLYNLLTLYNNDNYFTEEYLSEVEKYISAKEYAYSFEILQSIVDAYAETQTLDLIVNLFPKIGMFLRVIYRKSNKTLKNKIDNWINKLKKEDYYNSVYLEDTILTIK